MADAVDDQLTGAWLGGLSSARTRNAYARDLAAFVAWSRARDRPVLGADSNDIEAFRQHLQQSGASAATTSRRLSGLSSFFAHAVHAGQMTTNPVAGSDRPPTTRASSTDVLDDAETGRLRRAAMALGDKPRVLVSLLLDGLRLGEVLELDAGHVERRRGGTELRVVRRGVMTSVPISETSAQAIDSCLGRRRTGPVLVGESPTRDAGQRLTRFGADYLIKQSAARAGITRSVTASMLRRTFMIAAHRAGSPIEEIQRASGHGSRRETERFLAGHRTG